MAPVDARRLRRAIVFYATLAMAAISMAVATIAIGPLAVRLRDNARETLEHELAIKALAAEQVLDNARSLAQQVTSRTVIRERLEVYNKGGTTLTALTEFTRDKLADALTLSKELVGISRFTAKGEPVVAIGPYAEEGPAPPPTADRAVLGLRVQDARQFIVVAAPILSRDRSVAGTDVVVVDAGDLQTILDAAAAIGKTGWAAVVDVSSPPRQLMASASGKAPGPLVERLAARVAQQGKVLRDEGDDVVVAGAPLGGTSWILVQTIAADEATHQVDIFLLWVVVGAVMATALGVGGLIMVLRPLTGAILVQNADLECQVAELQQAKAELAAKSHRLALSNADLQAYAY
ncbi:MAG TPA: cache domain-containing protein, partial [Magnetospirillum sp.]|nr:cache domain-containing protein [Magnetospirillum sp.]